MSQPNQGSSTRVEDGPLIMAERMAKPGLDTTLNPSLYRFPHGYQPKSALEANLQRQNAALRSVLTKRNSNTRRVELINDLSEHEGPLLGQEVSDFQNQIQFAKTTKLNRMHNEAQSHFSGTHIVPPPITGNTEMDPRSLKEFKTAIGFTYQGLDTKEDGFLYMNSILSTIKGTVKSKNYSA